MHVVLTLLSMYVCVRTCVPEVSLILFLLPFLPSSLIFSYCQTVINLLSITEFALIF